LSKVRLPDRAAMWGITQFIAMSGDVHPHPGPDTLRVVLANVTALRPHIHEVLETEADVVALVETRTTEAGQRVLGALAKKAGWQPIWGKPMPSRGGIWDARAGGVALFVRAGLQVKKAVIPPLEEADA